LPVDLIKLTLDEMKERGDFHGDLYAPFYPTSYALHTFNILNNEKKFYYENKQIPNMRLHLLFIGPPMSSKTYYLEHMSWDENAIFKGTGFDMVKKGRLTETGLCGGFIQNGGRSEKRIGEAEKYANGFLSIDEFSAITDTYGQSYNAALEAQLLAALDHGNVVKDLGGGTIEFKTRCTTWGGIQPRKLHMENDAGLGRRICFLVNIPTKSQLEHIRTAIFRSKNIAPKEGEIAHIHDQVVEWREMVDNIERIDYDEAILQYYISNNTNPLHQPLSDRILLGYHLARGKFDHELHITLEDPMAATMVKNSLDWFEDVRRGTDILQVKSLIKSYGVYYPDMETYVVEERKLIDAGTTVSMTTKEMITAIGEMINLRMIGKLNKEQKSLTMYVPGKP
jgi:hypothetical protein